VLRLKSVALAWRACLSFHLDSSLSAVVLLQVNNNVPGTVICAYVHACGDLLILARGPSYACVVVLCDDMIEELLDRCVTSQWGKTTVLRLKSVALAWRACLSFHLDSSLSAVVSAPGLATHLIQR